MLTLGQILRESRENAGMTLRKAALLSGIDISILSKMERGERKFNRKVVSKLADLYNINQDDLLTQFLGEKVFYDLKDETLGPKALEVAEKSIQYHKSSNIRFKELITKSKPVLDKEIRIEKGWIFGSFARNDQRPGSDLDIIIKIKEGARFSLFDFAEIQFQLENILGLKVDLVEEDALSPLVIEIVNQEKVLIYER